MHDRRQRQDTYGESLAAMTTTGDGYDWSQRHAECRWTNAAVPGHTDMGKLARQACNRCAAKTAAGEGLRFRVSE